MDTYICFDLFILWLCFLRIRQEDQGYSAEMMSGLCRRQSKFRFLPQPPQSYLSFYGLRLHQSLQKSILKSRWIPYLNPLIPSNLNFACYQILTSKGTLTFVWFRELSLLEAKNASFCSYLALFATCSPSRADRPVSVWLCSPMAESQKSSQTERRRQKMPIRRSFGSTIASCECVDPSAKSPTESFDWMLTEKRICSSQWLCHSHARLTAAPALSARLHLGIWVENRCDAKLSTHNLSLPEHLLSAFDPQRSSLLRSSPHSAGTLWNDDACSLS